MQKSNPKKKIFKKQEQNRPGQEWKMDPGGPTLEKAALQNRFSDAF